MTDRRKLSPEEKTKVHRWAMQKEKARYGDQPFNVTVDDYVGEDGKIKYTALSVTETVMPKDWEPS